ncbi:MAG: FprA family A-type flavoprotein [Clostridiales bacterium]|nr:FprA family A-type flavoprotein [Clostridiales bacterium]
MKDFICEKILYIGANDKTLDLFEGQYEVPNGVSYNSYIIMDDAIAVMDTVDKRGTDEWLAKLEKALDGKSPDYLVISHLEPDHAANIKTICDKYPQLKLIGNAKTFAMLPQFFDIDLTDRTVTVKEGDTITLGAHTLQFFMAPMVHWPEVMVTYEQTEKVLFSADAFGKFGTLDTDEDWACEARRYYFNIVGKYGAQAQALLKKAAALDIKTICPLHGPILSENLDYYIGKYNTWSAYEPEDEGVFIAYASIYGNTAAAAYKLKELLDAKGVKTAITDLARDDMAEAVEDAFRYDRLVCAAATYDGGVFPCMEEFISHLKSKTYRKRTVAFIENGSWAPMAAKKMRAEFEMMKDITIADNVVSIKSTLNADSTAQLSALADELVK